MMDVQWEQVRESTVAAVTAQFRYSWPRDTAAIPIRMVLRGKLGLSNRTAQYVRRVEGGPIASDTRPELVIDDGRAIYIRGSERRATWECLSDWAEDDRASRDGDVFGMLDLLYGVAEVQPWNARVRRAAAGFALTIDLAAVSKITGPGWEPAIAPKDVATLCVHAAIDDAKRLIGLVWGTPWVRDATEERGAFWMWDLGGPKSIEPPRSRTTPPPR